MSKNMMNDHNQSDDQSLLFENIIDEKIVESNKKEPKRDYIGSSILGDKCSRKIQYMFMATQPDPGKRS